VLESSCLAAENLLVKKEVADTPHADRLVPNVLLLDKEERRAARESAGKRSLA